MEVAEVAERNVSPASSTLDGLPGLFQGPDEEYCHDYYFSEVSHALNILQGLNKQRLDGALCDVIICVEEYEFPCHRNVMAACSPYFLAMFTGEMREKGSMNIPIQGIDPHIMRQLIDYAYTSDITITPENAQHLLSAANMVQINTVREACCKFLEKEMDPSNCLGIHCFAESHVCTALSEMAREFALENFTDVAKHDEILLLPHKKLVEFIQSDELNVDSEEIVLQAVIEWVKHEPERRTPKFAEALSFVRLPLVSPYFLFDQVDTEPLLSGNPQCRPLLEEAMKYYILKDRHLELQSPRTRPRLSQRTRQLLVTMGGEIYNKNYLNNVDCYNFEEGGWMRLKELPFPRCHHGAALSDGRHIYVAGGFNKEKHVLNNVLRYEPILDKWVKVANMNTPRARHAMASLDGYIYVIGGYDGQSRIDSVERYSAKTNTWVYVQPMDTALSRCQAVGYKGYLYVGGGTTEPSNQCVDLLQSYNPGTDTWEQLTPMPIPRCLGGIIALNDRLYVVGGTEELVRASQKLFSYAPTTDQWEEHAEMIEPRFDAGVVALGSKIYVMSGHDGENSFYNTIEEYDSESDTWTIMSATSLPYGRCRFGCVALTLPAK